MVVGSWLESPFGRFADVMVETADGERTLLAPSEQVAEFVSDTYTFDRIEIGPVTVDHSADGFVVAAPGLAVAADWAVRHRSTGCCGWSPRRFARAVVAAWPSIPLHHGWFRGVRTAGSAGNGRREYYGVRRTRRIIAVRGRFGEADLGGVADLDPPVRFGFSSAPPTPQMVSVTTTIDLTSPDVSPPRPTSRAAARPAGPAGEHAAAEERPLQRAVAVHSSAAESGGLARGVQARQHRAVVCASPASRDRFPMPPNDFRVRMCSFTAISGPAFGSVSRCGATTRLTRSAR